MSGDWHVGHRSNSPASRIQLHDRKLLTSCAAADMRNNYALYNGWQLSDDNHNYRKLGACQAAVCQHRVGPLVLLLLTMLM